MSGCKLSKFPNDVISCCDGDFHLPRKHKDAIRSWFRTNCALPNHCLIIVSRHLAINSPPVVTDIPVIGHLWLKVFLQSKNTFPVSVKMKSWPVCWLLAAVILVFNVWLANIPRKWPIWTGLQFPGPQGASYLMNMFECLKGILSVGIGYLRNTQHGNRNFFYEIY